MIYRYTDVGDDHSLNPRVTPHLHLHVTLMKVTLSFQGTQNATQEDAIKLLSDRGEIGYIRKGEDLTEILQHIKDGQTIIGVISHLEPFTWHRTVCFHGKVEVSFLGIPVCDTFLFPCLTLITSI